ncbi:MAG: Rne/Rng family ribonuclease [Actinomycetota bacterium]|nr:Rne/Rng family ribonuclease [Actinomycetota bacterium]MDQ3648375.1 Rne/Rng family ribonuclease [Actinomycetota bacterium]
MKKQLLVTGDRGETRVAILETEDGRKLSDPRVAELYIERRGSGSIVGNIYKGKVDNVLGGLEAAFVDIGFEKNGFLHADDVVIPGADVARRGRGGRGKGKQITELLKPGQEVLVQAVKDPLKTKGPRLSMQLSIAGRLLVYVPQGEGVGVSRRLTDKERDRLRKAAAKIDLQGGGAIIRTAAQGGKREDFEREIKYLHKLHEVLCKRAEETPAPAMVFQEADLSVRVARDIFSGQFERAIVDDPQQHHRLESFFTRTAPELLERLELYTDDEPLFERYGAEEAIQSTLSRRVDLPSGGYLVIDYAEAMTVIDVNSGSFIGRGKGARLEDTIVKTNLESAEEVVRQLRLRDIGGIIVIDFIDMSRSRNRETVLTTLRKALDEDRTKTYVVEISPLGLVEMTRQNVTEGVREILTKACPTCEGEGVVLSEETVAIDAERQLRELATERPDAESFLIAVHPEVSTELVAGPAAPIHEIEADTAKRFHFEGSEALPIDHFAVLLEGSREDVEERALPFREGEEVLVTIEEPHMYNEDDAVAKLDAYVISVAGAGRLIGQKTMVRIEKVGRSAAEAELVDPSPAPPSSVDGSGEDSQRRGRRRGSRGGRGRRKSTADAG